MTLGWFRVRVFLLLLFGNVPTEAFNCPLPRSEGWGSYAECSPGRGSGGGERGGEDEVLGVIRRIYMMC